MRSAVAFVGISVWLVSSVPAAAQEPPPRIPLVVVDVHANLPHFPNDLQLAASRGITQAQLPGIAIGVDLGAHVYPFKWHAVTFGFGGQLTATRARQEPDPTTSLAAVTEKFRSLAPQISFNFGNGNGWSYLSGGIAASTWSIVPDGQDPLPSDSERLKTINYGGGARWFPKRHLSFSFDVRFYAINPSQPNGQYPSSPRTTLLVIGAGISVK